MDRMSAPRPNTQPPAELALARLLALVSRVIRESLTPDPPHKPLRPAGQGQALVDARDLMHLGQACRDLDRASRDARHGPEGNTP